MTARVPREAALPVDLRACSLSKWDGSSNRCRWDNKRLEGRQRSWCSPACYRSFTQQHKYSTAKANCQAKHRMECRCPRERFDYRTTTRTGEVVRRRSRKHVVCTRCGRCEFDVQMECNHRVPRLGDRQGYSCLHHADNLEMVCKDCHSEITQGQRSLWPARAERKRRCSRSARPVKRAARIA